VVGGAVVVVVVVGTVTGPRSYAARETRCTVSRGAAALGGALRAPDTPLMAASNNATARPQSRMGRFMAGTRRPYPAQCGCMPPSAINTWPVQ
jgi:hypothetical protein